MGIVLSVFGCSGIGFWAFLELCTTDGFAGLDPEFFDLINAANMLSHLSVPGMLVGIYAVLFRRETLFSSTALILGGIGAMWVVF